MSHICHTIQRSSSRMSREKYARIAEETLNAVEAGKYKTVSGRAIPIKALVDYSVSRTLLYRPGEPDDLDDKVKAKLNYSPKISVTNESTLVAGKRLQDKNPCVLNFASAKNFSNIFFLPSANIHSLTSLAFSFCFFVIAMFNLS